MTDLASDLGNSTAALSLGLALSSRAWRASLHRHCRDHESEVAVRLLTDGAHLLAPDGPRPDVVVVDDTTSWLTSALVDRLRQRGIAVLGVHDPEDVDDHGRRHLLRAGVASIVSAVAEPDVVLDTARALRPDAEVQSSFDALVSRSFDAAPAVAGALVVVAGPGGTGATELAIAIAAVLGESSQDEVASRPVLVEVDERRSRLARRLGLAVHPNLLVACDLLERRSDGPAAFAETISNETTLSDRERAGAVDLSAAFAAPALPSVARRPDFDVVVGPVTRSDASQLRADEVEAVLGRLREFGAPAVVKIGSELDEGPAAASTSRSGCSGRVLRRAELAVVVGEASPMGLLDLVDWLRTAAPLLEETPLVVVLNKAPSDRGRRERLLAEARRLLAREDTAVVIAEWDASVERAAWDALVAGGGPLRAAAGAVVDRVPARPEPPEDDVRPDGPRRRPGAGSRPLAIGRRLARRDR